jgi:FkbM family methyltransferase
MDFLKRLYWWALEFPGRLSTRFKRALRPQGPGGWIFKPSILAWAFAPAVRRQLPWPHRLFVAYAGLFKRRPDKNIPFADRLFGLATRVYRWFGLPPQLSLDLDEYKVSLNPTDPRMWQVPNELTNPDLDAIKLRYFLSKGDTFIDVGANHGSFSVVASKLIGAQGRIVAIEPQPTLAPLVEQSLRDNASCPFDVFRFACSDHEGEAEFYTPEHSSGEAGLIHEFSGEERHRTFTVQVKRFDDAVDWRSLPDRLFVKLDIEGSEHAFLNGASDMLRERRPRVMMELNPSSMAAAGVALSQLIGFFSDRGYTHFVELDRPEARLPLDEMRPPHRNVVICAPE